MAVTSPPKLDAQKLRADFPIFEQEINGKPLAYLDSAVSTHKPRQVLDKLRNFYETSYANVHRGVYTLSERSTAEYEGARQKISAAGRGGVSPPGISADDSEQSDDNQDDPRDVALARGEHLARVLHRPRELVLFQLVTFLTLHARPCPAAPSAKAPTQSEIDVLLGNH